MPVDQEFIATTLAASHVCHLEYRRAVQARNQQAQKEALSNARDLRLDAHNADPEHTAQAWRDEEAQYPHVELLAFYADQLAKL